MTKIPGTGENNNTPENPYANEQKALIVGIHRIIDITTTPIPFYPAHRTNKPPSELLTPAQVFQICLHETHKYIANLDFSNTQLSHAIEEVLLHYSELMKTQNIHLTGQLSSEDRKVLIHDLIEVTLLTIIARDIPPTNRLTIINAISQDPNFINIRNLLHYKIVLILSQPDFYIYLINDPAKILDNGQAEAIFTSLQHIQTKYLNSGQSSLNYSEKATGLYNLARSLRDKIFKISQETSTYDEQYIDNIISVLLDALTKKVLHNLSHSNTAETTETRDEENNNEDYVTLALTLDEIQQALEENNFLNPFPFNIPPPQKQKLLKNILDIILRFSIPIIVRRQTLSIDKHTDLAEKLWGILSNPEVTIRATNASNCLIILTSAELQFSPQSAHLLFSEIIPWLIYIDPNNLDRISQTLELSDNKQPINRIMHNILLKTLGYLLRPFWLGI